MKKKLIQISYIFILVLIGIILIHFITPKKYIVQYVFEGDLQTEIIEGNNQLDSLKKNLDSTDTEYWIDVY